MSTTPIAPLAAAAIVGMSAPVGTRACSDVQPPHGTHVSPAARSASSTPLSTPAPPPAARVSWVRVAFATGVIDAATPATVSFACSPSFPLVARSTPRMACVTTCVAVDSSDSLVMVPAISLPVLLTLSLYSAAACDPFVTTSPDAGTCQKTSPVAVCTLRMVPRMWPAASAAGLPLGKTLSVAAMFWYPLLAA